MAARLYLQHDFSARNDEKLLELRAEYGAEGYGIFWMLIECLAENEGSVGAARVGALALSIGVQKDALQAVLGCCLDLGLIYEKDGRIRSARLDAHLSGMNEKREARQAAARARWDKQKQSEPNAKECKTDANAMHLQCREEKRREEKRIGKK